VGRYPIIEEDSGAGIDPSVRLQLSFATDELSQAAVLRQTYGAGNAFVNDAGEWSIRKDDGKWYAVDPKGFDVGDIPDIAAEAVQTVPEVAGGIGGMVLGGIGAGAPTAGAGVGPGAAVGGVTGAALGGAAGTYARQKVGDVLGVGEAVEQQFGEEYLPTTQERMEEMGRSFLFAGATDAATLGAMKLFGKALAPMRAGLGRTAQAGIARAKRLGIDLSMGDIAGGRISSLMETALANLWGSAGVMQEFRVNQLKRLSTLTDDWLEKFGIGTRVSPTKGVTGSIGTVEAGQRALTGKEGVQETFQAISNSKYDEVASLAGADTFPVRRMADVAKEIVGDPAFEALRRAHPQAASVFELMVEKGAGDMNFLEAKAWRSMLGAMAKTSENIPKAVVGKMKRVFGALDSDMAEYASSKGGKLEQAFQDATRFYKEGAERVPGVSLLNGPAGKKLARLSAQPEDIIKGFFLKNNATELGQLKKLVGDDAFKELKEVWVAETMLPKIGLLDVATAGGDLRYTLRGGELSKFLDDMGDDTLKTIFKPTELRRLRRLAKIAKQTKLAERTATNPTGTAQVVLLGQAITGLGTGAMVSEDPVSGGIKGALGMVLLPRLLAKTLLSRPVRRYGAEGLFRVRVGSPAAKAVRGLEKSLPAVSPTVAREVLEAEDIDPDEAMKAVLSDPFRFRTRETGRSY
jgi:hypothetical protein